MKPLTTCFLRRAWLEHEEADFAPMFAIPGWRGKLLFVFAE
jgi:hypothetical protein